MRNFANLTDTRVEILLLFSALNFLTFVEIVGGISSSIYMYRNSTPTSRTSNRHVKRTVFKLWVKQFKWKRSWSNCLKYRIAKLRSRGREKNFDSNDVYFHLIFSRSESGILKLFQLDCFPSSLVIFLFLRALLCLKKYSRKHFERACLPWSGGRLSLSLFLLEVSIRSISAQCPTEIRNIAHRKVRFRNSVRWKWEGIILISMYS